MRSHLSRKALKKALQNLKSLLDEEGKPIPLMVKVPLAKELENIKKQHDQHKINERRQIMLYKKYVVSKIYKGRLGEKKSVDVTDVNSPFVLMPRKDPSAMMALECYAENCEPELGEQIKRWINLIKIAPIVLGTQGKRNRPFVK